MTEYLKCLDHECPSRRFCHRYKLRRVEGIVQKNFKRPPGDIQCATYITHDSRELAIFVNSSKKRAKPKGGAPNEKKKRRGWI